MTTTKRHFLKAGFKAFIVIMTLALMLFIFACSDKETAENRDNNPSTEKGLPMSANGQILYTCLSNNDVSEDIVMSIIDATEDLETGNIIEIKATFLTEDQSNGYGEHLFVEFKDDKEKTYELQYFPINKTYRIAKIEADGTSVQLLYELTIS